MAHNKEELALAINRLLDTSGQQIDTPAKAVELRLSFARNLATEVDTYIQVQISASLTDVRREIQSLSSRIYSLQTSGSLGS